MIIVSRSRLAVFLFLLLSLLFAAGCDHLPFMPRQEIDSFPTSIENLETMEVEGVTYVRVVNPARQADPKAAPATWIPQTVYRKGNYQAYTANLPRPREPETQVAAASDNANPAQPQTSGSPGVTTGELAENLAPAVPAPTPRLRRRLLLFPSQVSLRYPGIATQLEIELEKALPVRVREPADPALTESGRLLSQPNEIRRAIRRWLGKIDGAPPVQFVIFLTLRNGRDRTFLTCNWIDAQTGGPVAAFTFTRDFQGRLWYPLVPSDPVPLVNLVTATPWWCRIERDPAAEDRYLLDAGHRSDLGYGRELKVYGRGEAVRDPASRKRIGFAFSNPLGTVSVVDFFGSDGALARARKPLPESFRRGYAVEIPEPPAEPEKPAPEKNRPVSFPPPRPTGRKTANPQTSEVEPCVLTRLPRASKEPRTAPC